MRKMRRFAAIAAAAAMTACMAVPMTMTSFAATPGKITFTDATNDDVTGHSYTAYKIFSGTVEEVTNEETQTTTTELKGIQWADATGGAAFLAALKDAEQFENAADFANCETAAAVAQVLAGYANDSDKAKAFAEFAVAQKDNLVSAATGETLTVSEDGYYVIAENALGAGAAATATKTAYLLGVYDATEGAEIALKKDLPTFQKKIQEKNDSTGVESGWQDAADYDVNDPIAFQLTATLPSDYAEYENYMLVFHDDIKGDVFDTISITNVYYDANDDGEYTAGEEIAGYVFSEAADGCADVADFDCDFTVTIEDLKKHGAAAAGGNVIVEYTMVLNEENAVLGSTGNWNGAYLEYSNDPYWDNSMNEDADETNDKDVPTSNTPEDKVVAFTYKVSVDKVDESDKALSGAGFTLYKYDAEAADYVAVGSEIKGVTTFTFSGLDAGQYKLVETTVPGGYTKAEDVEFVIEATYQTEAAAPTLLTLGVKDGEGADLADGTANATFTADTTTGTVGTKVVNKSGSTLPSTGGIGTTIFYVVGGALAAGAGVSLIAKKRMKNED